MIYGKIQTDGKDVIFMNEIIAEKLKMLPERPGVYIMRDESDVVIYVGKARILKNRVRQYFQSGYKPEKVAAMVARIEDFSYIITATEIDALALENNLIKKIQAEIQYPSERRQNVSVYQSAYERKVSAFFDYQKNHERRKIFRSVHGRNPL